MRKGRDAIVERLDESETSETNPSETWKNLHLNRTNVEAFSWKKGKKACSCIRKVSTHTNLNRGIFLCWWFRGACPIVDLLTFFPAKGLDIRSVWMEIFPSFRRICFAGFTFIKSFLRPSRPDKLHGLCSPGVVTTVTNDILLPRN